MKPGTDSVHFEDIQGQTFRLKPQHNLFSDKDGTQKTLYSLWHLQGEQQFFLLGYHSLT